MGSLIITILALIFITLLEIIALIKGFDGVTLAAVTGIIAGLAGYKLSSLKARK